MLIDIDAIISTTPFIRITYNHWHTPTIQHKFEKETMHTITNDAPFEQALVPHFQLAIPTFSHRLDSSDAGIIGINV
jgi:hypothetical protein